MISINVATKVGPAPAHELVVFENEWCQLRVCGLVVPSLGLRKVEQYPHVGPILQ